MEKERQLLSTQNNSTMGAEGERHVRSKKLQYILQGGYNGGNTGRSSEEVEK